MKAEEILDMIGDAKGAYIWDAQQVRSGRILHITKRPSVKRIWLIAALTALALLLVGCGIVYVLRLQDMKVGQYRDYIPTEYDEYGNVIPVETRESIIQLSIQGTNMEALAEWVAFTNTYDLDGSVMAQADQAAREGGPGNPWDFPENYHLTYDCYSREMMDTLDRIVETYDLKLLSEYTNFEGYESLQMLEALSAESLLYEDSGVQYLGGRLYPEGTFSLELSLTRDMGSWTWENGSVHYRYSLKDYFDPATDFMLESQDYAQWDYTRRDGRTVLLVLNETTARIYADLPKAFVSISLKPVIWVNGAERPMTAEALEQLAEVFDLSVQPKATTQKAIAQIKAEAAARQEAEQAAQRAAAQAEEEAQYIRGYQEFVNYRLETIPSPATASYILYDVNGDGIDELVINCWDILSMKDGQSYQYFDPQKTGVLLPRFRPCEGKVFEIWSEDFGVWQHYFYQAGPESASFLTGVIYDSSKDIWYRSLSGGAYSENRQEITEGEAQVILDSYTPIGFDWLPLKKFGQTVVSMAYTDPYAQYIANILDRYDEAVNYGYALMDLSGDGVEELITREGETLRIHTIRDGQLWDFDADINAFSYICQGGILETAEGDGFHEYSRVTEKGVETIEKIVRDPYTLYWGRVEAGKEGRTVTEEEAMGVLASYRRLGLDMKPFDQYPFQ